MNVITSFSKQGYAQYGRQFIDSFLANWPEHVKLWVATEGYDLDTHHRAKVNYFDLTHDPAHEDFCETYAGPEFNDPRDFNMMSVRFAHKVYAKTSPNLPNTGWRIWIDGDVVTHSPVSPDWLNRCEATYEGCTAVWNETVGAARGFTAIAPD